MQTNGEHLDFMEILGELTTTELTSLEPDAFEEWQSRPLDPVYPLIVIDTLPVKTRENSTHRLTAAIALDTNGYREILGLWLSTDWPAIFADLKTRGVQEVCVISADESSALPEAATSVWPKTFVALHVTHLTRACTRYATRKDLTPMAQSVRAIWSAADESAATAALKAFTQRWQKTYPAAVKLWRLHWTDVTGLWKLPPEIRRVIYTTSQIELIHSGWEKTLRQHGYFPSSAAALATFHQSALKTGRAKFPQWRQALQTFTIHFDVLM